MIAEIEEGIVLTIIYTIAIITFVMVGLTGCAHIEHHEYVGCVAQCPGVSAQTYDMTEEQCGDPPPMCVGIPIYADKEKK